ncbi:MAG TPA: caspase family protein [Pyrinomonadaceae bacterium]|nr:caspase family protein [Pyrinomonadaceae bacterium]
MIGFCDFSRAQSSQSRQLEKESTQSTGEKPDGRFALVIGNGGYTKAPALKNPANDANSVAASLRQLGFQVSSGVNKSQREMRQMIREFGEMLRAKRGVGLFYFAGHGVQVKGRNYLIPVDADIQAEPDIADQGVPVDYLLTLLDEARNGLNVVILDACRNNPFAHSLRTSQSGLAETTAPSGTLIAYATAPNQVAYDGDGPNSSYAEELLKQLPVPGVLIETVFRRVAQQVAARTKGKQDPWILSNVKGDFYFVAGPSVNEGNSSILITKLINPPDEFGRLQPQKIAVWVSITGTLSYIIDSVEVNHDPGGDTRSEPQKIDEGQSAKYVVGFTKGSKQTYVLDPALEINPQESRDASLTLLLAPRGFWLASDDRVEVSLHYHAANAESGKLFLKDPPPEIKFLSKSLGIDIDWYDLIVTPDGSQRGSGGLQTGFPRLIYRPMEFFPTLRLARPVETDEELAKIQPIALPPDRAALHAIIEKKGGLNKVFGFEKGGFWDAVVRLQDEQKLFPGILPRLVMNICSTLSSRDCDDTLAEIGTYKDEDEKDGEGTAFGLETPMAISHLFKPTPRLAEFILSLSVLNKRGRADTEGDPASCALLLYPSGKWAAALMKLAAADRDGAMSGLYLRRELLNAIERKQVEDLAWKNFSAPEPEEDAVRYLAWRHWPTEEIKKRLLNAGPQAPQERERRSALIDEILGGKRTPNQ